MGGKEMRFNEVFANYYHKVFRLCKGYFNGDEDLAADAAQEAFIRVWQNLDTFRGESSISTWVYRISVNTCLILIRTKKRRKEIRAERFTNISNGNDFSEKEEKLDKMYACIQKLKPRNRMIILMVLENISYDEIAQVIGISEETLRVRIHRIKKRLTNCVQL